jgi:hypothetical protein
MAVYYRYFRVYCAADYLPPDCDISPQLQAFRLKEFPCHFHRGTDHCSRPFGNAHGIAHMIVMAVADQDVIGLHFIRRFCRQGVPRQKGIH